MSNALDLKATINLPRTSFKMKANLPNLEPSILRRWQDQQLYEKIREARKGRPTFILHDGPPYANGHIHLGHALNKILKDLIVKSRTMEGYDSPYVPGWDCHGLPIEIKVAGPKRAHKEPLKIRQECRKYAEKFVRIQKEEFKRLGVFGDWDSPYLTMSYDYEAETARLLGRFVEKGSVYKGLKPVHWCISCETALAEAEVEYAEHTSPSVYVAFPLLGDATQIAPELDGRQVEALIWTTTPWTLPANLAICFHPKFDYALVEVEGRLLLLAEALMEEVAQDCGWSDYRVVHRLRGDSLQGLLFRHPWLERESVALLADHVTLEQGTGAVHTAPGHGHDDYIIGVQNGLEVYNPVDDQGRFVPDVEHFSGMEVFEANPKITEFMRNQGCLVGDKSLRHSYPHCWRCRNPVIFRATPQWFIRMDHADLRQAALQGIEQVQWIPAWGEERIHNMIAQRPDWCISRQRVWGVPIPAFSCSDCKEALLTAEVVYHVAERFDSEGADAWYRHSAAELLPDDAVCECGSRNFEKEYNILDVWFDSGVSHAVVLDRVDELPWPADVYLEGGDQYRGWFHSSLLVAVGVREAPPYRTVICNGWTLDSEGRAMSKSLGNVISPLDVMKDNGAEILRLWTASINYTEDVRLGEEMLSRLRDAYRKLRNTQRFLLGNLHDFDPAATTEYEFSELDRWALARTAQVAARVEEAYRKFEFHRVYHTLYNFCIVDLSSFYLDISKDQLYIGAPDSPGRRATQKALHVISDTLVRLLAPILPFTSEEVWGKLYPESAPSESVHLAEFSRQSDAFEDEPLLRRWDRFLSFRDRVSKALEESRQDKVIGNSLAAALTLTANPDTIEYLQSLDGLRFLFLVSQLELETDDSLTDDQLELKVEPAPGSKCQRCWHTLPSVGTHPDIPSVCSRCYGVLQELESESSSS